MDKLEHIQKLLDSHSWGEKFYLTGYNGDQETKYACRQCLDCHAYDDPNNIQECTALKYCQTCSRAVSKASSPDNKCPKCKSELTNVPPFTAPLPTR